MDKEQLKKQLSKPGFAYVSSAELREIAPTIHTEALSKLLEYVLAKKATHDDVRAFIRGDYIVEIVAHEYDDVVAITAGRDLDEVWNSAPWIHVALRELFAQRKKIQRVH